MHSELFFWSCEDHGQASGVGFLLVVQMPRAGVVVQRPLAGIRVLFGRGAAALALEASYTAASLGHGQVFFCGREKTTSKH